MWYYSFYYSLSQLRCPKRHMSENRRDFRTISPALFKIGPSIDQHFPFGKARINKPAASRTNKVQDATISPNTVYTRSGTGRYCWYTVDFVEIAYDMYAITALPICLFPAG